MSKKLSVCFVAALRPAPFLLPAPPPTSHWLLPRHTRAAQHRMVDYMNTVTVNVLSPPKEKKIRTLMRSHEHIHKQAAFLRFSETTNQNVVAWD